MVTTVFLFANGNTACTDEHGQQVPAHQRWLLGDYLRELRIIGAIDDQTEVLFHAGLSGRRVGDLIGESNGQPPETSADILLDAITAARVALEAIREDTFGDQDEKIDDALSALRLADRIRAEQLKLKQVATHYHQFKC